MSTEGTPDPALEPEHPVGGDAAGAAEPASPAPEAADASAPASSYPPPGYAQAPYGQPSPQPGGYEQQPGYQAPPPGYGYQQPGYQQPYGAPMPLSPSDERLWATLAHIGPVLTSFVAPLLIWLVFRERSRFVDDQGKEALNFQIFLAIVYVVGAITTIFIIGFFILLAGWILAIVFGIQGAMTANRGEPYRYPLTWRVLK